MGYRSLRLTLAKVTHRRFGATLLAQSSVELKQKANQVQAKN